MVSWQRIRLNAGAVLTEAELRDIPHPTAELILEYCCKQTYYVTIIGLTSAALAKGFLQPENGATALRTATNLIADKGIAVGACALTFGATAGYIYLKMVKGYDSHGMYDKALELRRNRALWRVDRGEEVGFFTGLCTAKYMDESLVAGAIIGSVAGVVLTSLLNTVMPS